MPCLILDILNCFRLLGRKSEMLNFKYPQYIPDIYQRISSIICCACDFEYKKQSTIVIIINTTPMTSMIPSAHDSLPMKRSASSLLIWMNILVCMLEQPSYRLEKIKLEFYSWASCQKASLVQKIQDTVFVPHDLVLQF
jgi:hypothetical protein